MADEGAVSLYVNGGREIGGVPRRGAAENYLAASAIGPVTFLEKREGSRPIRLRSIRLACSNKAEFVNHPDTGSVAAPYHNGMVAVLNNFYRLGYEAPANTQNVAKKSQGGEIRCLHSS